MRAVRIKGTPRRLFPCKIQRRVLRKFLFIIIIRKKPRRPFPSKTEKKNPQKRPSAAPCRAVRLLCSRARGRRGRRGRPCQKSCCTRRRWCRCFLCCWRRCSTPPSAPSARARRAKGRSSGCSHGWRNWRRAARRAWGRMRRRNFCGRFWAAQACCFPFCRRSPSCNFRCPFWKRAAFCPRSPFRRTGCLPAWG